MMKSENEVREYKKYLEEIIEYLNKSHHPFYDVKSTVLTLEDEIEVLKCVLNEKCNPIGGNI